MWHSYPEKDYDDSEFYTYDGLEVTGMVLRYLEMSISQKLPPDSLVVITSHPMDFKLPWFSERQKTSKNLRQLQLQAKRGQPFRLFCRMCGHDSTDEMEIGAEKAMMINVEMKMK